MLSKTSCDVAINIADILISKGLKLVPKGNSIVQELSKPVKDRVVYSISEFKYTGKDNGYLASLINYSTEGSYKNDVYDPSEHDALIDGYIEDLTQVVSSHVRFSKEVVNKQVSIFTEKVTNQIQNFKYRDVHDFFSITYYRPSEVFFNQYLVDELQEYKSVKSASKGNLNLGTLSTMQDFKLKEYLITGIEELDKEIVDWVNTVGEANLFSYIVNNVEEFSLPINKSLDYTLVNYLFYRNLSVKTDLNIAKSLTELRQESANSRDYFALSLAANLNTYAIAVKNLQLFTSDSNFNFSYLTQDTIKITILEESFEAFAQEGGTIDMIFGYIASNSAVYDATASDILTGKDKFLSIWNSVKNMYLVNINNNKLDTFKTVITTVFDMELSQMTPEEVEAGCSKPDFLNTTKELAYKYIDELELEDMSDIEDIALMLIAGIRFRFSSSYYLLNKIKNYLSLDEEMEPKQAALFASIDYMVKYLVDQVDIVKVTSN